MAITNAHLFCGDRVKGGCIILDAGVRDDANGRSQACPLVFIFRLSFGEGDAYDYVGNEVGRTGLSDGLFVAVRVRLRYGEEPFFCLERVDFEGVSRRFCQDGLLCGRRQISATVRVSIVVVAYDCSSTGQTGRYYVLRWVLVDHLLCFGYRLRNVPF